jgi:hypothetical protein
MKHLASAMNLLILLNGLSAWRFILVVLVIVILGISPAIEKLW